LTTLRLGFLKLGPQIRNLELEFHTLGTLYLHNNKIQLVNDDFFESMPNLKFLALQDNQIEEWFDIRSLTQLEFLDLRNNKLPPNSAENLP